MITGIEFHRLISLEKLFCKCRYLKSQDRSEYKEFVSCYNKLAHKYYTSKYYCEYEREEIPMGSLSETILSLELISKLAQP